MPRSLQEILDHAEELARQFEQYEPDPADGRDAAPLRAIRAAVIARSETEREIADAVQVARKAGHTWASIGAMLGTSGEAARQRYGERRPTRKAG
jgi:FAD/FMN-containing dehydrogenase